MNTQKPTISEPKSEIREYFYLTVVLFLGVFITLGLFLATFYMEYRSERRNMQVTNVNFASAIEYMTTNQIFRLQNLEQEVYYAGRGQSKSLLQDRFIGWIRTGFAQYAGMVAVKANGSVRPVRYNSLPEGRRVFSEVSQSPAFQKGLTAVSREGSNHFSFLHSTKDEAYLVSFRFLPNKKEALVLIQEASKVYGRLSPLTSWDLVLEQQIDKSSEYFRFAKEKNETVAKRVSPEEFSSLTKKSKATVFDQLSVFGSSGKVYSVMRNSARNELIMPWVVLLSGLTITTLLSLLVYSLINRNLQIQQLVTQKTLGLEIESQKAREAAVSKGKFIANVSHEVRTPLNLILGMADLLNETTLDRDQKEYVEVFRRAGSHLMRLIDDILDIAKSDLNDVKIRIQWVNTVDLAEEIMRFFEPLCESKGLFFQLDIDPNLPEKFLSDPSRLRQIVINLLNNAIKFTERGYVRLSFALNRGDDSENYPMIVTVSDSGLGIPKGMRQAIFEEFVQVDDSSKRSRGGVGLGLSIVKTLLNKMGGRVELDSAENEGSTFRVYLQGRFENDQPWVQSLAGPTYGSALYIKSDIFARPGVDLLMKHISSQSFSIGLKDVNTQLNIYPKLRYDLIIFEGFKDNDSVVLNKLRASLKSNGIILLIGATPDAIVVPVQGSENIRTCVSPISTTLILKKLGFKAPNQKEEKSVTDRAAIDKDWAEDFKDLRVLVAEDDPSNRFMLEAYLKNYPIQVDYAANGKEAIELFAKGKHDIIVTDLHMPVMDGYELIRKVRLDERDELKRDKLAHVTPIIVLTADVQDSSIKKVKESGQVSFISKPVSKTQLLEAVHTAAIDLS